MDDIFENAIDSIVMGLEDYSSSDPKRLGSCTRNLSGELIWVGNGKKTVDVYQIKERFNSLGINTHWKRVEKIQDFRNNIEHYHSNLSKDAIRSLLSNSFIVIRDFISLELNLDPKECLGDEAWNILVSETSVYEREKEECINAIAKVDWSLEILEAAIVSFECSKCGSGLISIRSPQQDMWENDFYCRSCEMIWNFEEIAEAAIEKKFYFDNYWAAREGNDSVTIICPECFLETYHFEEQYCLVCGAKAIHECLRCGIRIPSTEINESGYCSWCSHKMSKGE